MGENAPAKRRIAEIVRSDYQPSKAELEEDISVPVTLEELAKAALSGGAKRRTK